MKVIVRPFFIAFLMLLGVAPATGQGTHSWPQYRKDNSLSARVGPLAATPRDPGGFLTVNTGGAPPPSVTADLYGKGVPDVLFIRGGRLRLVRGGQTIFENFYGVTDIDAVVDLDGDGPKEIIVHGALTADLVVLNADGTERGRFRFPEFVSLSAAFMKIADVSPERPGKEIIVFPDHTATQGNAKGYFFDARLQLYASPTVLQLNGGQLNFPQIAVGDIDRNGIPEVVVVGRPWLLVYNGDGTLRGQTEFREGDPEGRHYGLLTLANVDATPDLEAVVIADEIPVLPDNGKTQAITVFKLTPTMTSPNPTRLWGVVFPNENPRACSNSVSDLDGDGRAEICLNVWTGQKQSIRIYAGDGNGQGSVRWLGAFENRYVWDIADVNGDGRPEVYSSVSFEEFPSLPITSMLEVFRPARNSDGTLTFLLVGKTIRNSQYLLADASLADADAVGASNVTRTELLTPSVGPKFFSYFQSKKGITRLRTAVPTAEGIVNNLNAERIGAIRSLFRASETSPVNFLIAEESGGALTGRLNFFEPQGRRGLVPAQATQPIEIPASQLEPRVADIDADGSNEILLRLPSRRVGVFAHVPTTGATENRFTFEGTSPPTVADLDAPDAPVKRPEIITTRNDGGRFRLSVYQSAGSLNDGTFSVTERWGMTFPEYPADATYTLAVGRFLGKTGPSGVFLSFSRSESVLLDGAAGKIAWRRADVFFFGNGVGVRDADGDGDDDLYVVANNAYSIRDGATGAAVFGPVDVRTIAGDFYSTPVLTANNETLLAGPARVVRLSAKNERMWDFAKLVGTEVVRRTFSGAVPGVATERPATGDATLGANYGPDGAFSVYRLSDGLLVKRTPWRTVTDITTLLGPPQAGGREGLGLFVFGTSDGNLVAVRSDNGETAWTLPLGAYPTTPVIAQLGPTGTLSLIVSIGDGGLRIYPL